MVTFKTPVIIEPGVIGRYRIIRSPAEAVAVMRERWPDKTTEKYRRAYRACVEAASGAMAPHHARNSFVAAAREARVLIDGDASRHYTLGSIDLTQSSPN